MTTGTDSESPYRGFRFKAVVDWIEVRVTLAGPSQPRHVRDRIRQALPSWGTPPYVTAETENPSRTASAFVFRVQDPANPDRFMQDVQAVARPGDPLLIDLDIEILGIEVAIDAYSVHQNRTALVDMAHHFFAHHARPPSGPARCTGPGGHGEIESNPREFRRAIAESGTINAGERDSEHRTRYYVKDYDTLKAGRYEPIPADQHRARMEVTLAGPLAPFATIDGWRNFRFETLAHWLTLREKTTPATPFAGLMQARTPRHGNPDSQPKRLGHRRMHRTNTKADTEAYELVRNALRGLTRGQRGKTLRTRVLPKN